MATAFPFYNLSGLGPNHNPSFQSNQARLPDPVWKSVQINQRFRYYVLRRPTFVS